MQASLSSKEVNGQCFKSVEISSQLMSKHIKK